MAEHEANIVIRAVDRLSAPIRRMQNRLDRLGRPLRRTTNSIRDLGSLAGVGRLSAQFRTLGGAVSNVTGRVGGLATGLAGLAGISLGAAGVGLVRGVIGTAAEFERYETVLTTITGSAERAAEAMSWITDFTTRTPYELSQVTEAFTQLRAYGVDATDGSLRSLGDAASAMNKDLMAAVEMLADARTGEFERLKEFGIRGSVDGDIARFTFTDADGVERQLEAGRDDAEAIQAAILTAFELKGFDGAMEDRSRTLDGLISNLRDQWTQFQKQIADAGVFDYVKERLSALLTLVGAMAADGRLQEWAERISTAMVDAFQAIEDRIKATDWQAMWEGIKGIADRVKEVVGFFGGWENTLIVVIALMNAGLIAGLVQLGVALLQLAILGAPGLLYLGSYLPGAFAAAGKAVAGFFAATKAAIVANPILWPIMAIAFAAYAIYKNWDGIVAYFQDKIDRVRTAFDEGFVQGIMQLLAEFNPLLIVSDTINGLVEWMTGVDMRAVAASWGNGIRDGLHERFPETMAALEAHVADMIGAFRSFEPLAWIEGSIRRMSEFLFGIDLIDAGEAIIDSLWQGLRAKWDGLTQWLDDAINGLLEWMPGWVKDQLGLSGPSGSLTSPSGGGSPAAATVPGASAAAMVGAALAGVSPATAANVAAIANPADPVSIEVPAPIAAGASGGTTIEAPVNVAVTVNGLADVDVVRRETEEAVRRALDDWRARESADRQAALYD